MQFYIIIYKSISINLSIMLYLLIIVKNVFCANPDQISSALKDYISINIDDLQQQDTGFADELRNEAELRRIMNQNGLTYKEESPEEQNLTAENPIKITEPTQDYQYATPVHPTAQIYPEDLKFYLYSANQNENTVDCAESVCNGNSADVKNDDSLDELKYQNACKNGVQTENTCNGYISGSGGVEIGNVSSGNKNVFCSLKTNLNDVKISSEKGKVRIGCFNVN